MNSKKKELVCLKTQICDFGMGHKVSVAQFSVVRPATATATATATKRLRRLKDVHREWICEFLDKSPLSYQLSPPEIQRHFSLHISITFSFRILEKASKTDFDISKMQKYFCENAKMVMMYDEMK
eukprot:Pompholyxophrys_punicea_v1_NODE_464_length_1898_cov_4.854042.p2 type:complete len:125 gc:universal NODE_464_length_1898_cov_4.854042:585-211(-)